ncbi:galactose-binding domain-containing protein [Streptomyces albogriseolus]|uniref:galactose-binding domain-containing protein n=1 Tax=Streptomyces albogriseolus TaxID=1887 RepID=UPI003825BD03
MRRTRFGLRTITGLLLAGLVAAGLSPGTAGAAAKAVRGPDLALGRSVTATGSHPGHPAAHLTDGSQLTYWEGPLGSFLQSVRIDLGGTVRVDEVVLKLPAAWEARTQTLTVEGGTDGSSFTALSASAAHRFDPDRANTVTLTFPARDVRHLRIRLTANTGWNAAQLSAVEVYGEDGGEGPGRPPADGTDLALGRPVEASSTIHSFVAAHANDGRIDTYWESAGHPATLTVRLGAEADVTAVVLKLNPDAAWERRTQSIEVLGRDRSSSAYTTLKARADHTFDPAGNGNTVTVPVTGRVADVQLRFSHNSAGYGAQVAELEVRGTAAPNPDLTVTTLDWTPAAPTETDPVTVRATVRNAGTAPSAAATLSVSLEGTVVGSAPVGALAPGASATENNNVLSRSIVVGRGAAVPYTEYEAEDGAYRGSLLTADPVRTFGHTNFATESSGRESVRLDSTGQYVEFTSTTATNSIVVRNSIPDAPGGGGTEATLSLYADGTFVRKLGLSSKHSWLYGTTDQPEGLTDTPQADARRLFDESHALLDGTYPAGTTFRLQRDADDSAAFYVVDLIDLEQVAPPAEKPAGCVSVTEYGAVPNDGIDDTTAIQRAVTADQRGEIDCVWIPAGQWRQEQKILTDDPLDRGEFNQVGIRDVTVRGAGMWHSQLHTLTPPHQAGGINHPHEGNFGFDIDDNTRISDLAIFGSGTIRGGDGGAEGGVGLNGRFGKNTRISNVWIEHANVGVWVGRDHSNIPDLWNPADGLEFTGMRIRNTYADGINLTNGSHDSTVQNSSFRNTGDDALAVWSSKHVKNPAADTGHDNHFRNNTVQLPWRANGIAIYGGHGNTVENNLVYDTMNYPGIMLATDHDPTPFSGQTLIAGNGLYRTGGAFWNEDQEFGAITLFAQGLDIPGVVIRDTDIHDSTYDGIQFKAGGGAMPDVRISDVTISKSNNGSGILAMGGARGSATLTNVTVTGSAEGDVLIEPGSSFVINR